MKKVLITIIVCLVAASAFSVDTFSMRKIRFNPTILEAGSTITVEMKICPLQVVRNVTVTAGVQDDKVYLNTVIPKWARNDLKNFSFQWTPITPGKYRIIFLAEPADTSLTRGIQYIDVDVVKASDPTKVKAPDLVIKSFTYNAPSLTVGAKAKFTVEFANVGTVTATSPVQNGRILTVLLQGSSIDVADATPGPLAPGATYKHTFETTFKTEGNLLFTAGIDPYNQVKESDENNNGKKMYITVTKSSLPQMIPNGPNTLPGITTTYQLATKPDLIITKIWTEPEYPVYKKPFKLFATVKNTGAPMGLASSFEVRIGLDRFYPIIKTVGPLSRGEEKTLTWDINEILPAKLIEIIAEADIYHRIDELNEVNNTQKHSIDLN
ncbi:MAG: hypothetical protein JW737_05845 [Acidobacteria bacterium]|nr:hypothetical protein [Acidobacteriota bacterium]